MILSGSVSAVYTLFVLCPTTLSAQSSSPERVWKCRGDEDEAGTCDGVDECEWLLRA